jgi:predicted RNA binding protein YcfA (HicA-like mRNA interferase family)
MRFLHYLEEAKLPIDSKLTDVINVLKHFKFELIRQQPHIIMRKGKLLVSIPNHKRINSFTLANIIKSSQLNRDEFLKQI